ncbi:MAG: alpha/beta fold hydrolase [Granulosicoccaceae bacterium]
MKKLSTGLEVDQRDGLDPVVFCMHGIGGNTASFEPQLRFFSGKQAVIAWNMPGYGGSEPLEAMSFESLARCAVDALDELGLEKAVFVGQSIGGMVALELAARYPARVQALVLIGTTPSFGGRDEAFKQQFLKARLAPLDAGATLPSLAVDFVPQIVGSTASAEVVAAATQSMSEVSAAAYRATIECLVTFNRRADLTNIDAPCLLISGGEDRNAPARTMQKMADKLPNARYHCIEEAGHLINLEAAPQCNALIESFIGELV